MCLDIHWSSDKVIVTESSSYRKKMTVIPLNTRPCQIAVRHLVREGHRMNNKVIIRSLLGRFSCLGRNANRFTYASDNVNTRDCIKTSWCRPNNRTIQGYKFPMDMTELFSDRLMTPLETSIYTFGTPSVHFSTCGCWTHGPLNRLRTGLILCEVPADATLCGPSKAREVHGHCIRGLGRLKRIGACIGDLEIELEIGKIGKLDRHIGGCMPGP